jgi:hypothetical protein
MGLPIIMGKFAVWKYHMKICFDEKEIMLIKNGTEPKPIDDASEAKKAAWQTSNTWQEE